MPIYEYRCGACGHHLEALQKMTDGPLRKCPDCGRSQLRRLMSAPQFRLKGSGWYETDFKKDNETKRNLVEKAGAESSEASKPTETAAKDDSGKDSGTPQTGAEAAPESRAPLKRIFPAPRARDEACARLARPTPSP